VFQLQCYIVTMVHTYIIPYRRRCARRICVLLKLLLYTARSSSHESDSISLVLTKVDKLSAVPAAAAFTHRRASDRLRQLALDE
jgi:hypothetical protein